MGSSASGPLHPDESPTFDLAISAGEAARRLAALADQAAMRLFNVGCSRTVPRRPEKQGPAKGDKHEGRAAKEDQLPCHEVVTCPGRKRRTPGQPAAIDSIIQVETSRSIILGYRKQQVPGQASARRLSSG